MNAVKLPYNPTKAQRDVLYSNRVNPVVFSPGVGIVLFGDKTGLAKASAFDRINVRRLFIYLEDAISAAAKDQLFEFNDEVTRTNFVNTIEPFLRDVQSNEELQITSSSVTKPTIPLLSSITTNLLLMYTSNPQDRSTSSVQYLVATKTGVDFEEVIGNF